jgi:hypothetical protein
VKAGRVRSSANQPSNIEITPHAIQSAWQSGLFNGKAVFIDHAALWEYPSLENLVGVTQTSTWNEAEGAIEGTIKLYSNSPGTSIALLLDELLSEESPPDIGLSIVFYPQWEEKVGQVSIPDDSPPDNIRKIIGITHIESIDLVFEPAADGRILQALSAFHVSSFEETAVSNEAVVAASAHRINKGDLPMPSENPLNPLPESVDSNPLNPPTPGAVLGAESIDSPPPDPLPPVVDSPTPFDSSLNKLETLDAEIDGWINTISQNISRSLIKNSDLPQASRDRLLTQTFTTPEEVTAAIDSERHYLAQLQEDTVINLPGAPPRSARAIPPALRRLRDDRPLKRVVNEFQQYPMWWTPVVSIEDFSNLQTVRWITLGGIGELPTVSEGAAYTELTWDDVTETAAFVKKGGYLGITLESIDKDDTGRMRAAPRALAQAAWLTLSKALSSIFTANSGAGPAMSDSIALFHASHANLGTTALSVSSYAASRTAMRKQTELHSGERLGALTAPKFLLVPPDLEITALQANALTEGDTFNQRMQFARSRVIVIDLWTDTNNWAASAKLNLF